MFRVRVRFRVRVSVNARARVMYKVMVRFWPGANAWASVSVRFGLRLGLS